MDSNFLEIETLDPEAEAVEKAVRLLQREVYVVYPSRSNEEGWETRREPQGADRRSRKCTPHTPERGSNGRFISKR